MCIFARERRGERLRVGDQRSGMAAHARQNEQALLPSLNRSFGNQKQINNDDYGNNNRKKTQCASHELLS